MATMLKEPAIAENIIRKGYTAGLEIKEGERAVIFTVSTSAIDRDKEVILPKGIDLKAYRKNPVVLWAHSYGLPPIAKAQWIKVVDDALVAKAVFAETPLAEEVYQLLCGEFLRTTSVGFIETEWREPTEKDLKEHPDWAEVKRILSKIELLEFSIVPVPSNRESLAIAVGKGMKVPKEVTEVLGGIPPKSEVINTIKTIEEPVSEEKTKYNCECIKCGHKVTSEKHCKDIKCPKCGGEMRRVERPGPGRAAEEAEAKELPMAPEPEGIEILKAEGQKPTPNEHSCDLADEDFDKYRRVNCEQKHDGKCIDVMYGIKDGKSKISSLRYKKDVWTAADASAHCKTRKGRFIAATRSLEPPSEPEVAAIDKLVERVSAIVSERENAKLTELVERYKEARDSAMANEIARKVLELINVEKMIDERINEARGRV